MRKNHPSLFLFSMRNKIMGAILLLSGFLFQVNAKDIIITKNAEKIEANVVDVNRSTIVYQLADDSTAEKKTMLKSNIVSITYGNGAVEVYNSENNGSQSNSTQTAANATSPKVYKTMTCADWDNVTIKGDQFIYNNRTLSNREVNLGMRNCCPEAYQQYKSGQKRMVAGVVTTSVGAAFAVVGGVFCGISAFIDSWDDDDDDFYDDDDDEVAEFFLHAGIGFAATGVTAVAVGVPLWVSGAKKKNSAQKVFRDRCIGSSSAYQEPIHLDLTAKKQSIGLALKF